MTVLAKDAAPGKFYRLTRDPGTTYYLICAPVAVRELEKRLGKQRRETMRPRDRFTLDALERVKAGGHVLAVRHTRYAGENGDRRETRAYVAFPHDYVVREVEKPPGYRVAGRREA